MNCSIELLAPKLLEDYSKELVEIDDLRLSLGLDVGWHYSLDIIWILNKISTLPFGSVILDAGAGKGILQFAIAEKGFQVVSVDFSERRLQFPIRLSYKTNFQKGDLTTGEYLDHMTSKYSNKPSSILDRLVFIRVATNKVRRFLTALIRVPLFLSKRRRRNRTVGEIFLYQSNILHMPHIKDASIDALVSLSAIEHLRKSEIVEAVKEFRRVLKPDGYMIITTNAAMADDWYHEPSMGWCFSERSLIDFFHLDSSCPSNWSEFKTIHEQIRDSRELKKRLPPTYAFSGENGMPWGVWDPQYVPVGLVIKPN